MSLENREFWRDEKIAFLALSSMKGVGFWSLHKFAEAGLSFKEVLRDASNKIFENIKADQKGTEISAWQEELWRDGLSLARDLQAKDIKLVFQGEERFPPKLKNIPDAPFWIFVQGEYSNLFCKSVAVVGTRKPSADGDFLSKFSLAALAKAKCVTVSGLALGVDQLAHIGSLRFNLKTIAVLGTGMLQNYPRGSELLRSEILAGGGSIVTEYLPQQSYSAENFVRRNRIQAALCDLLIPVEWEIKSGTAHTVKFANRYGKKIVNLYLPGTYGDKPELEFSKDNYGAEALEIPTDTARLVNIIESETSEDQLEENISNSARYELSFFEKAQGAMVVDEKGTEKDGEIFSVEAEKTNAQSDLLAGDADVKAEVLSRVDGGLLPVKPKKRGGRRSGEKKIDSEDGPEKTHSPKEAGQFKLEI